MLASFSVRTRIVLFALISVVVADYRVNQSEVSRQQFLMAYKKFTDLFSGIAGTTARRELAKSWASYRPLRGKPICSLSTRPLKRRA
ncbi:MAG TPA: hypothetical protein VE970_04705 [Pseudolabrys sp.]|nr:hypothetical protein [Pseudolabrys sp.]